MKNTGLIEGGLDSDYIQGVNSPIIYEERNTNGNWDIFLDEGELQNLGGFDRMNCVTQSAIGMIESQINWELKENLLPKEAKDFLINNRCLDKNNQVSLSERYTAKLSGTTPAGNRLTNIWYSVSHDGCVPDSLWPDDPTFNWSQYYSDIPQNVKDIGKQFLKYFFVQYEALADYSIKNFIRHLKQSPIQITVATENWGQVNIPPNSATQANHAIYDYFVTGQSYNVRDSYNPFNKVLAPGYKIFSATKGIVTPIPQNTPPTQLFNTDLFYGQKNEDIRKLQSVLNVIEPTTGYYGELTRKAVWGFQQANSLGGFWEFLFWRGKRVDLGTRNILNKLFKI